jgi:ubiquinone/menaquinone biosynthesis C-methylase UbiE
MSVIYYSQPKNGFSDLYIKVRKKENRFYSEEEIKNLPDLEKNHPHYEEWKLRQKSTARFVNYAKGKNKALKILEIGCGNGWFSHLMSTVEKTKVVGLDVNIPELEQAANAFQKDNLAFVYADLFEKTELNAQKFDIVVFNSCLQYFENLKPLFQIVSDLLMPNGEIHIIDTPFYKNNTIEDARKRTQTYYKNIGFPEMSKKYFHHRFEDLEKYKVMHKPFDSFLKYFKKDSPFCWILIQNH